MHLSVTPSNTFNFDKTALYISILPRKTYGNNCTAGRKIAKERLTIGFLVNADGSRVFRPLAISMAKRSHDFRPDYNPEELCYWRHNAKGWMTSSVNPYFHVSAVRLIFTARCGPCSVVHSLHRASQRCNVRRGAEHRGALRRRGRAARQCLGNIVVLKTEGATMEDLFGFRTCSIGNVRLVYLPPNTTCFTQPLDQGLIAMAKARTASIGSAPSPHVEGGNVGAGGNAADIGLDEEVNDVGLLIDWLRLGSRAMAVDAFVGIDDNQPTCTKPGKDSLIRELATVVLGKMWEAPANMQVVYDVSNPASREALRTVRAACEMLIDARAMCITLCDLCALFDIRNPTIIARMERASPPLDLNSTPPPAMTHADTPSPETPRRRGQVLPAWMAVSTPDWVAQSARRQELIDAGAPAVISGYIAAAEWMRF
ncbi:unnamed protein product [Closterium sp. Yama58-4]|nr:unnamed protein product [Closterium sp. Yama58-4]